MCVLAGASVPDEHPFLGLSTLQMSGQEERRRGWAASVGSRMQAQEKRLFGVTPLGSTNLFPLRYF